MKKHGTPTPTVKQASSPLHINISQIDSNLLFCPVLAQLQLSSVVINVSEIIKTCFVLFFSLTFVLDSVVTVSGLLFGFDQ